MIEATAIVHPTAKVHPTADIGHFTIVQAGATIGEHARIWSHANICANAVISKWAMVGHGTEIGRGSFIGVRARIGALVFLPANSTVGKCVFIGPRTVATDDRRPKVLEPTDPPYKAEPPTFEDHANVGAGVTILPGVRVGARALIGAGAVICKDVDPDTVIRGLPSNTISSRRAAVDA